MNFIKTHSLYTAFSKVRSEDTYSSEDITIFQSIILNCAKEAEIILSQISETFKQYTLHDINHSINVANRIYDILPKDENGGIPLTALELTILWCSILLHDSGMAVTDEEKKKIFNSKEYNLFLSAYLDELKQQNKDTYSKYNSELAMFAEYIRRQHEVRSKNLIESPQFELILKYNNQSFASIVGRICESHCWGVRYSQDITNPDKTVLSLEMERKFPGHSINERYLACCLRLGDILDFDYTRTPELAMNYIDFTQEKSLQEWQKHLGVQKLESGEHRIIIQAECSSTQQYVDVNSFTDWIDKEIQDCSDLLEDINPKHINEKGYVFKLSPVVKRKIGMIDSNYIAGNFKFQLEYDEIIKLMMDKALYPDPSLFLRELLQNALDACRMQDALVKQHNKDDDDIFAYAPHIAVFDHSEERENPRIIFQDNGIGMSEEIVRNYFLRVGKSYYRSDDFKRQQYKLKTDYDIQLDACSNFGIGFLSCFLVGNRIKVETYKDGFGNEPLEIEIDGANKYFTIKKVEKKKEKANRFYNGTKLELDGPPNYSGTRITVFIDKKKWDPLVSLKEKSKNKEDDDDADDEIAEEKPNYLDLTKGIAAFTLKTYAVNVDYPITIHKVNKDKNEKIETKIEAWGWEPELPPLPLGLDDFWRKYLVPVRIPFKEYEETKGIRGGAWFWFLNDGNGKPTTKRGFLKIGNFLGYYFKIDDPVLNIAVDIKTNENKKRINKKELIKKIESLSNDDLLKVLLMLDIVDEDERSIILNLIKLEKEIIIKIINGKYKFEHSYTPNNSIHSETLLKALLNSDLQTFLEEASKKTLEIVHGFELLNNIALHGILTPAGMTDFNPQTGVSEKIELLDFLPISYNLDFRSFNSIVPNASRLSISSTNSKLNDINKLIRYIALCTFENSSNNMENLCTILFDNAWIYKKEVMDALFFSWENGTCFGIYNRIKFNVHYNDNSEEELGICELTQKHGEWVESISKKDREYYEGRFGITKCNLSFILIHLPQREVNEKVEIHVGRLLKFFN